MNIRFHERGQMTNATLRVVDREVEIVNERLSNIARGEKHLSVTVEQSPRDDSHTATLVLRIPRQQFAVRGTGTTQDSAMRDAFDTLLDRIERYRAYLTREPEIRRARKLRVTRMVLAQDAIERAQDAPPEPPPIDDEFASWDIIASERQPAAG